MTYGPTLRLPLAAALLTTLIATTGVAQNETFTPEHVAKLKAVVSAEISPDGARIAYVVACPRTPFKDADGGSWTELHVADVDGTSRPYISGEVNVGGVTWAPDGKSICFLTKRAGDKGTSLYRIPVGGGEAQRVFAHDSSISSYSWSHDGKRIAFRAVDPDTKRIAKHKKAGVYPIIYEEDFRYPRLWVHDLATGKSRKIGLDGAVHDIAWSPTDNRIAVSLAPTPLVDDSYMFKRLSIVDANDGEVVCQIENPGKLGAIAWSPNGKQLAFMSGETIHDPSDGRMMVANTSTGAFRNVWPGMEGSDIGRGSDTGSFAWQDDKHLMMVMNTGPWTEFYKVAVDGSSFKKLFGDESLCISGLSLSANGQAAALLGESARSPNELYLMRHGDTAPKRLTDVNPWLAKMRFAKQRVVRHPARDGLELQGVLIEPLDRVEGRRYPLIMCVHGGPEAHVMNGWVTRYAYAGQVGAARGFAVFYPNYRGSTGRGVKYSMLGQADAAGKEFDDLVDAKEHLVKSGLVDPAKVGVTGGSYGGYATAWCATKLTEHFAAGVMFVGISNKVSKAGTSDIPMEMYLVHDRSWPWEKFDFLFDRSPIKYVAQAKTPLLIMHGEKDPRVHPGQALELHRMLKLQKKPVRLIFYRGEGHGNRRAATRYDYNLRMLRWFEHYLKGDGGNPPPTRIDYPLESRAK